MKKTSAVHKVAYIFYKSALPSDTLSAGRKLSWKYTNIVPLLVICLLLFGRICKIFWSSPEVLQFSQQTIILYYSRDCRPVKFSYFRLWSESTPALRFLYTTAIHRLGVMEQNAEKMLLKVIG